MQLVERHIIRNNKEIDKLAFLSKNLYNYTNYVIRQAFTRHPENIPEYKDLMNDKNFISEYDLSKRMAKLNQIDYRSLPPKTSQQIIKLIYGDWLSYFRAIKDYKKNPSKYLGRPRLPHYKDKAKGRNIIVFTNQSCVIKQNKVHFPKSVHLKSLKTKVEKLCRVRIVPKTNCYIIEVVYNKEVRRNENLNKDSYISIDLGVNNICSITSNQHGIKPFLVNGRIMKSINQYYNKKLAKCMSFIPEKRTTSKRIQGLTFKRNNKIEDSMHKISRHLVNFCLKNNVGNIVIGYNEGWKQEVGMGKPNNQKFIMIPFARLIQMIQYKAALVGINIILIHEFYTSKCDSLALESIECHDKYLGKRIKRGMFKSSTGKTINADTNGSLNILRKVIGDGFVKDLINTGVGLTPNRLNIY